ncbi:MAG: PAS domain-containing protein [Rhodospirillaceae bacterium]
MDADTRTIIDDETLPPPFGDVIDYWRARREGDWAPPLSRFALYELPPPILPWSIVADVIGDGADFHYRFWGTERVHLINAEMTGKRCSEIANPHMRDANLREYRTVFDARVPQLCRTPVVTGSGRDAVFQSLRLPLAAAPGSQAMGHIYSAMNYLQVTPIHYEFYGTRPRVAR